MTPAFGSPSESLADNRLLPAPAAFSRLALVQHASQAGAPAVKDRGFVAMVAALSEDGQVRFDYYPTDFSGPAAAQAIRDCFAQIATRHRIQRYDAILVVGGPELETDIGVIHQVLAPCIEQTPAPVFSALGPDDAETILGDTAFRVFPNPEALIQSIADVVHRTYPPADEVIERICSLSGFLLAEHEIESKILMQASLLPAIRKCFKQQAAQTAELGAQLQRLPHLLSLRVAKEEAALEQVRALIAVQVARLAQKREQPPRRRGFAQWQLNLGIASVYAAFLAFLWWRTTPANLVFFGGCGLVVISAVYVALSNRIADQDSGTVEALPAAADQHIEPVLGEPPQQPLGDPPPGANFLQGKHDERFDL